MTTPARALRAHRASAAADSVKERRTVVVGAVRVESRPGEIVVNLAHATPFVEQAAAQGANLVVLPELFSSGYVPNRAVWDAAEPAGGATDRWLASTSERLGIYLGAGSVETDAGMAVLLVRWPERKAPSPARGRSA